MLFNQIAPILAALPLMQCSPMPVAPTPTTGIAIMQCKAPVNSGFRDRTELWVTDSFQSMTREKSSVAYHGEDSAADKKSPINPVIDVSASLVSFPDLLFFTAGKGGFVDHDVPAGSIVIANGNMTVKPAFSSTFGRNYVIGRMEAGTGALFEGLNLPSSSSTVSSSFQCKYVAKVAQWELEN